MTIGHPAHRSLPRSAAVALLAGACGVLLGCATYRPIRDACRGELLAVSSDLGRACLDEVKAKHRTRRGYGSLVAYTERWGDPDYLFLYDAPEWSAYYVSDERVVRARVGLEPPAKHATPQAVDVSTGIPEEIVAKLTPRDQARLADARRSVRFPVIYLVDRSEPGALTIQGGLPARGAAAGAGRLFLNGLEIFGAGAALSPLVFLGSAVMVPATLLLGGVALMTAGPIYGARVAPAAAEVDRARASVESPARPLALGETVVAAVLDNAPEHRKSPVLVGASSPTKAGVLEIRTSELALARCGDTQFFGKAFRYRAELDPPYCLRFRVEASLRQGSATEALRRREYLVRRGAYGYWGGLHDLRKWAGDDAGLVRSELAGAGASVAEYVARDLLSGTDPLQRSRE